MGRGWRWGIRGWGRRRRGRRGWGWRWGCRRRRGGVNRALDGRWRWPGAAAAAGSGWAGWPRTAAAPCVGMCRIRGDIQDSAQGDEDRQQLHGRRSPGVALRGRGRDRTGGLLCSVPWSSASVLGGSPAHAWSVKLLVLLHTLGEEPAAGRAGRAGRAVYAVQSKEERACTAAV